MNASPTGLGLVTYVELVVDGDALVVRGDATVLEVLVAAVVMGALGELTWKVIHPAAGSKAIGPVTP